jgi:Leucine-rich repeat (LRR) protein
MSQNISLEELIPNPKSLRLLILHTPFPLTLNALQNCTNLIKLDLSNNNLTTVPYLGHLNQLRFFFLHNNRLDFDALQTIFSLEPNSPYLPPSSLAKNIVWVTMWGNKNCLYARHYLVNHTAVVAVDKHIVVEEERSSNIHQLV